jgi:Uma2 family endonuclease
MGTKTLMSLAEFEALPDDGERHELIEGELIKMPPPQKRHNRVVRKINSALTKVAEQAGTYVVYVDAGFRVRPESPTVLQPDIAVFKADRDFGDEGYFEGAPDLAIEVVSPGDSADRIEEKVHLYLSCGASAVWIVYATSRLIHVRRNSGVSIVNEDSSIDAPEIFPGWSVRVSDLLV